MLRQRKRFRVGDDGIELIDPDASDLPFLTALDPRFEVRREGLGGFVRPRLRTWGTRTVGLTRQQLGAHPADGLWVAHGDAVAAMRQSVGSREVAAPGEPSLLDLKIELARRELQSCALCGHRCGVNRLRDTRGVCGLGRDAMVAEAFVHIAEEPPINPALNLNLVGCGLRCRFCQQFPLLSPGLRGTRPLDGALWADLPLAEARSLAFVGGNPDESVYGILRFLREAPADLALPVVWNCHGYATSVVYRLLDGIVDCYLPDLKYWADECAWRWSAVAGYRQHAVEGIRAMANQGVAVLVRMLVLPGHLECCHRPALEWLASEVRSQVCVNVMGQYHPDYLVQAGDGALGCRPSIREISRLRDWARALGLRMT